jgi:hypothetical protein
MISQPFPTRGSMWGRWTLPPLSQPHPQFSRFPNSVRPSFGPVAWGDAAWGADEPNFAKDMEAIIRAFTSKNPAKGAALTTQAALVHGPKVVEMATEIANSKSDSIPELEQKLAKYKYEYARASGDKKLKYKYKIEAVERQIATLQKIQTSALAALDAPASYVDDRPKEAFPTWLPIAAIGGITLLGAFVLLARK